MYRWTYSAGPRRVFDERTIKRPVPRCKKNFVLVGDEDQFLDLDNSWNLQVLGKNTYSILYTLNTDPSITGVLTEDEDGDKTTLIDTFSIEDLSLTLDMLEKTERKVTPSLSGGVETSSSASESLVYLLSKNKVNNKRFAYRDRKTSKSWYTRLDKVMNQICNKKRGYETTDKNAFQLYNELKKEHLAICLRQIN